MSRLPFAIFMGKLLVKIRSDNMPNLIERNPVKDKPELRTLIYGPISGENTSKQNQESLQW